MDNVSIFTSISDALSNIVLASGSIAILRDCKDRQIVVVVMPASVLEVFRKRDSKLQF